MSIDSLWDRATSVPRISSAPALGVLIVPRRGKAKVSDPDLDLALGLTSHLCTKQVPEVCRQNC